MAKQWARMSSQAMTIGHYIWTTYHFLKFEGNGMAIKCSIYYMCRACTVTPNAEQRFNNPLYSPELRQYFTQQWWGYVFLWGNINKRVVECTRRTTATIEVQHKILKTFDITKRNLAIDEYLLQRTSIISANQLILAEKLLFKSSIME